MELKEKLRGEMITALKAVSVATDENKEAAQIRLSTLRAALGSITKAETAGKSRVELNDKKVIAVLRKMVKQRQISATKYLEVNRPDRASLELAEVAVLEEFMPPLLDETATRNIVASIIAERQLEGSRAVNQVMSALSDYTNIDSGLASKIARELL